MKLAIRRPPRYLAILLGNMEQEHSWPAGQASSSLQYYNNGKHGKGGESWPVDRVAAQSSYCFVSFLCMGEFRRVWRKMLT